jgi:hypothetical protein
MRPLTFLPWPGATLRKDPKFQISMANIHEAYVGRVGNLAIPLAFAVRVPPHVESPDLLESILICLALRQAKHASRLQEKG